MEELKFLSQVPRLTSDETDFIVDALNFYWNDAARNLQRKDLGDIEKRNYEYQKEHAFKLMKKLM